MSRVIILCLSWVIVFKEVLTSAPDEVCDIIDKYPLS